MRDLQNKKIFLVDEDIFQLHLLKQILISKGYNDICIYENVDESLLWMYTKPSVIFLDFQLGYSHGFELINKLKRYYSEIKVVIIIESETQKESIDADYYGIFDFILKNSNQSEQIENIMNNIYASKSKTQTNK
ncbi:MAG: response regulator [Paludibacter sp.]